MALNGTILGGSGSFKAGGILRWYDADESAYAGLKSAAVITGSVDYTLPVAWPVSDGYVLSSTTAGVMSWTAAGSGTVTGTGTNNYIAVWSGAGSLDSDINFQYDSSLVAMSIGDVPSASVSLFVNRTGATTVASEGIDILNASTSSTASINKFGLAVSSTGTWNGASAINYCLYLFQASGGTTNWALYNNTGANVYLGTGLTMHGTASGTAKFTVLGSGTFVAPVAGTVGQFQASTAAGTLAYLNVISGTTGTAGIAFGDTGNSAMGWCEYDNNTDTLYLGAGGAARVSVNATADLTALNGLITVKPSTAYSGPPSAFIDGEFKFNAAASYSTMTRLEMGKENATDGNNAGYFSLYVRSNGGGLTKRLNVDSSGVVNIANLTASKPVFTDASKNLVSQAIVASDIASGILTVATSGVFNIVRKSANYSAGSSDCVIVCNGASDFTITLPVSSVPDGHMFIIIRSGGAGLLNIVQSGGPTLDSNINAAYAVRAYMWLDAETKYALLFTQPGT